MNLALSETSYGERSVVPLTFTSLGHVCFASREDAKPVTSSCHSVWIKVDRFLLAFLFWTEPMKNGLIPTFADKTKCISQNARRASRHSKLRKDSLLLLKRYWTPIVYARAFTWPFSIKVNRRKITSCNSIVFNRQDFLFFCNFINKSTVQAEPT